MATCSSIADPVFDFQLPEMDVLLMKENVFFCLIYNNISKAYITSMKGPKDFNATNLHVDFVVRPNLLNSDIVLRIDERLGGGVCLCQGHDTSDVLKLTMIVHFHL